MRADQTEFGVYLHVPFCATRCGYCDFNTYTAGELGSSASPQSWRDAVLTEIELAATELGSQSRPITSVFVGGGTPSLIGADMLNEILGALRTTFGLADGAEVTTEANPESTSARFFEQLLAGGFNRVSLGMQATSEHVLKILDRTHTRGRALAAAHEARQAGFEHLNLDLIYGTPGETEHDLSDALDAVVDAGVDHVSAYALIVEDGTALARRVRRGELSSPDDDVLASRYELVDMRLRSAGLDWYEVSNWARSEAGQCRHNLGYWRSIDWWGFGPGAHSHIHGRRWWNTKHPARYAAQLAAGELPIADSETLTTGQQHVEEIMLGIRLRAGVSLAVLSDAERRRAEDLVARGLVAIVKSRLVLTDRGRLLADAVVRELLD